MLATGFKGLRSDVPRWMHQVLLTMVLDTLLEQPR